MPEQVVGEDGLRVGADVDRVAAEPAEDPDLDARRRAQHGERVVALGAVDVDALDADERDEPAGAVDALGVDHEVVVGLGADHDDRVEAVAAVDRDRCVRDVLDQVAAAAGVDAGLLVATEERAHDELVVAGVAVQLEDADVVEHVEVIGAVAAVDRGRVADAVGQLAAGGRGERDGPVVVEVVACRRTSGRPGTCRRRRRR